VRINNVDRKNNPNKNYCFDCFYLIKVAAERPTEASIIIPTPDAEVPIITNSLIKDILLQNETTTFRVFCDSSAQFEAYVQYGKIRIIVTEVDGQLIVYNETL
jgi:hypothetical protein